MAQKVTVVLTDDIDGSEADETLRFALDGVEYEIDLSDTNATDLRERFAPFVEHGRRIGGRRGGTRSSNRTSNGSNGSNGAGKSDLGAMREWARGQGMTVSDRGRVSNEIQDAYAAAH